MTATTLAEKPERMTIDEIGKVVPASPKQKEEGWVSWFVWCEACSKLIKDGLTASAHALSVVDIHRAENPGHPPESIKAMTRVHVEFEVYSS